MKKTLALILVLALCALGTAAFAEGDTFKLGWYFGLTGGNSAYGIECFNGVKLGVDYINKNGGLNGKQIEGLQPVPLGEFAMISFAEEGFLFLSGSTAQAALEMKKCAYLSCRETEETCALASQDFILGRTNVWGGGTFQDRRASRFHGRICCGEDGKRILIVSEKETPNGTFLNGRFLSPGFIKELSPGDVIAIGHVYHIVYHEIVLKGEK